MECYPQVVDNKHARKRRVDSANWKINKTKNDRWVTQLDSFDTLFLKFSNSVYNDLWSSFIVQFIYKNEIFTPFKHNICIFLYSSFMIIYIFNRLQNRRGFVFDPYVCMYVCSRFSRVWLNRFWCGFQESICYFLEKVLVY